MLQYQAITIIRNLPVDACAAVPKLLITVGGKAVITLSLDISNNIRKIETKQKLHPRKSDTLQAMIHLEIGLERDLWYISFSNMGIE